MLIKEFFTEHRKLTRIVIWMFLVAIVLGMLSAYYYPELMAEIVASFDERFGESPALDINLASKIFIQNVTVSAVAWLGGILLGIAPVLVVAVNGFILGYVVFFIAASSPRVIENLFVLAVGLIPHGIFELPAFLAAAVLGLRLGWEWLTPNAKGHRWSTLRRAVVSTGKYYIFVVLALAVAAIIEVFISGELVGNL